jgi:hypothetical protein
MTDLHRHLKTDHVELVTLFQDLRNAVEGADGPTIQRIWTEFETRLLAHMDGEEKDLLPELEPHHPEEVARVRQEHARIRALLLELGIQADLHTLRKAAADALVALLQEHAAREDGSIYGWAETEVSPERRLSLLERIRRPVRRGIAASAL